tara:strand:+ start:614 stop:1075 length:462 start_codon:yes stop_codon:yes gene_type:complete
MKKFILNIIIFIFISGCGYVPIYSVNNNKVNFEIGKVNINGDRDLNQNIINQLKNLKTKKASNPIIYNLTIDTKVKKIITSKDSKGNPITYKMISTVNLATIKEGKEYNLTVESVENYNDISSKFELETFERNLKKNSASKIIQEIIVYLITL